MAYIFHRGQFIKGKVQNGLVCDEEDEFGNPYKVYYSKFIDDEGRSVITLEGKKFRLPVARTKKSLWKKIIELNKDTLRRSTEKLTELNTALHKMNVEITEALIKEER